MYYCSRSFTFDSAHRVMNHSGNCKFLHGHRYILEVQFASATLNDLGMVIDFWDIKTNLGKWIEENLDHNTILWQQDTRLADFIENETGRKPYLLAANPTAENIAGHVFHDIIPSLFKDFKDITCPKLRIYESNHSFIEVTL